MSPIIFCRVLLFPLFILLILISGQSFGSRDKIIVEKIIKPHDEMTIQIKGVLSIQFPKESFIYPAKITVEVLYGEQAKKYDIDFGITSASDELALGSSNPENNFIVRIVVPVMPMRDPFIKIFLSKNFATALGKKFIPQLSYKTVEIGADDEMLEDTAFHFAQYKVKEHALETRLEKDTFKDELSFIPCQTEAILFITGLSHEERNSLGSKDRNLGHLLTEVIP